MAEEAEQRIMVDWERDSALGDDDTASETTSLRSSVFNHVYENGRRYNGYRSGAYCKAELLHMQPLHSITHH
jgi:hypothetical protein